MPEIRIKIEQLYKSFGTNHVLQGADIDIFDGEILFIIGKSGTGKSVMLKHISGLLTPDSGRVLIDGEDLFDLDDENLSRVRRKMGILFQMAALFDSMTVYENVAFTLRRFTKKKDSEIHKIVLEKLELVGLRGVENLNPSALSQGMQKRVGLARAIAIEPQIVLYDEPTTAVDPILGAAVDDLIGTLNRELGVTSIVISHDMKSVFRTAHRVALLHEGRFIKIGTPDEYKNSDDPAVRQFVDGVAEGPMA